MKLGEAKACVADLNRRIRALESRISSKVDDPEARGQVVQLLLLTSQRARDLEICISWTNNCVKVADENLSSVCKKQAWASKISNFLSSEGLSQPTAELAREYFSRADEFRDIGDNLSQVIRAVDWGVDLQVPDFVAPLEETKK